MGLYSRCYAVLLLTTAVAAPVVGFVTSDRGYVTWDHTTTNQHGEVVMTYRSTGITLRRTPL